MIIYMFRPNPSGDNESPKKEPPGLWASLLLLVLFVFGAVLLFGLIIYLLIRGAEQLEWPPVARLVILVIVSGIFAWLLKRISDTVSGLSHHWFPEEEPENDPG